jgi:hypothetical protein
VRLGDARETLGRALEDREGIVVAREAHVDAAESHLIDELRRVLPGRARVEFGRAFVAPALAQLLAEHEGRLMEVGPQGERALP